MCIAQSARFNAIVAQVRTLNRERLAILQDADRVEPQRRELLLQRAQGLEHQAGKVLAHAATVKNALRLLIGGILLMVLCSLTIGASLVFAPLGNAALALFVLGLGATARTLPQWRRPERSTLTLRSFRSGSRTRPT